MKRPVLLLLLGIMAVSTTLPGQNLEQLKRSLGNVSAWDYRDETDIEAMVDSTSEEIILFLEAGRHAELDTLEELAHTRSEDGKMGIYNFYYPSGGTMGDVEFSVIQVEVAPQMYRATALGEGTRYDQIYALPAEGKKLFLLMGGARGSSIAFSARATVIEITGDSIRMVYPGFEDDFVIFTFMDYMNSGESDCIACLEYDAASGTLEVDPEGILGEDDHIYGYGGENKFQELDTQQFKKLKFDPKLGQFRKLTVKNPDE